jgi:hypothetical protein
MDQFVISTSAYVKLVDRIGKTAKNTHSSERAVNHFFEENMPKSNGCHDVNIMGYHDVNIMTVTSPGLSYKRQWLLLWYDHCCLFVSLQLCVDFCSNIIFLSIEQQNGMAR